MRMITRMKGIPSLLLIAISWWLAGCSSEPEPLEFGIDACYTCKMTLVDRRFGAELVTKKGKVYKFDDMNCMLGFYHSGWEEPGDFVHRLAVDFETQGSLLGVEEAFYIKAESIRSPMASQIAAFESYERAMAYKRANGGIFMAWGEVSTQFK